MFTYLQYVCVCVVCRISEWNWHFCTGMRSHAPQFGWCRSDSDLNFKHPRKFHPVESKYATQTHRHTQTHTHTECESALYAIFMLAIGWITLKTFSQQAVIYVTQVFCCVLYSRLAHITLNPHFRLSSSSTAVFVFFFFVGVVIARILITQTTGNHTKFKLWFSHIRISVACKHITHAHTRTHDRFSWLFQSNKVYTPHRLYGAEERERTETSIQKYIFVFFALVC